MKQLITLLVFGAAIGVCMGVVLPTFSDMKCKFTWPYYSQIFHKGLRFGHFNTFDCIAARYIYEQCKDKLQVEMTFCEEKKTITIKDKEGHGSFSIDCAAPPGMGSGGGDKKPEASDQPEARR